MFATIFLVLMSVCSTAWSHGRLIDPPGRSTMWRPEFGNFPTEELHDDDALWCGGFPVLWANRGKCGICGDRWDGPSPRDHEDGGKYGQKIIVRTYQRGEVIDVKVQITTHHLGHFEFRLCPMTHEGQVADQECLDRYLLPLADGTGTKYLIPTKVWGTIIYTVGLKLPDELTCERCVLQWHYRTGNNWGVCENGTSAKGCGKQEYFRGCADIAIVSENDIASHDLKKKPFYKKPPFLVQAKNNLKTPYPGSGKHLPSVINSLDDHIPAAKNPNKRK